MKCGAICGDLHNSGKFAENAGSFHERGTGHFEKLSFERVLETVWTANREQFSLTDNSNLVTAICLFHIMCGYKKRDALIGELIEQSPQGFAGEGIDPRRGFVQKKNSWFVQNGIGKCQAL